MISGAVVLDAWASSWLFLNKDLYGPQLAWSGGSYGSSGFFHSKVEDNPWLMVHIEPLQMSGVTLINRRDCCGERLMNLEVRAGSSVELEGNPVLGKFKGPGVTGAEHFVSFGRRVTVEYISFQVHKQPGVLQINGIRPSLTIIDERWSFGMNKTGYSGMDIYFLIY